MFAIVKLFIFFIIFIITCESAGLRLLNRLNIYNNIIAIPVGGALFGCLYEFLVLPVQFFSLDSSLLKYALILSFVVLVIYGKKELLNIKKHISKRDILLLIVFIIIFVLYSLDLDIYGINMTTGDDLYYIPSLNGMSLDGIAVNGPLSNLFTNSSTSSQYAFYGQLHFYSAISNLFKIDALITYNFFHKWYFILFYITNIYNICKICIEYNIIKNINKYLVILFICVSYISALSNNDKSIVETITMLFIAAPLIFYLKDKNKGWLVIFSIFAFYATTIRSTYIFLLAFLVLPYYLYLLINNQFEIKENVMIIAPILYSLILFISYKNFIILLLCLFALTAIIILLPKFVDKIGIKYTKYIYYLILFGIFIYFVIKSMLLGNVSATWDNILVFDLLQKYFLDFISWDAVVKSLQNISFLFFGIVMLVHSIYKHQSLSYPTVHIVLIYILCLNMLVAPFIAHFLIEVYKRLFWMWINPLLYLLILDEFIEIFKDLKVKKIVNYSLSLLLVLNFSIYYSIEYIQYIGDSIVGYKSQRNQVSTIYKVGDDSLTIGKEIEKYAIENNSKYVQIACPVSIINLTLVSNRMRLSPIMGSYNSINRFSYSDYFTQKYNEQEYDNPIYFYLFEPYRFFDDWHLENEFDNVPDLASLMRDNNVDIFVISKWSDREETNYHFNEYLNTFSRIVYDTGNYLVCVVK